MSYLPDPERVKASYDESVLQEKRQILKDAAQKIVDAYSKITPNDKEIGVSFQTVAKSEYHDGKINPPDRQKLKRILETLGFKVRIEEERTANRVYEKIIIQNALLDCGVTPPGHVDDNPFPANFTALHYRNRYLERFPQVRADVKQMITRNIQDKMAGKNNSINLSDGWLIHAAKMEESDINSTEGYKASIVGSTMNINVKGINY